MIETRRTRQSIGTQIAEALTARGLTWEYGCSATGQLLYLVEGMSLTPGETADKYLDGGFAGNYGRGF